MGTVPFFNLPKIGIDPYVVPVNPVPVLTSFSNPFGNGDPADASGAGFISSSIIRFNGLDVATIFNSGTSLSADQNDQSFSDAVIAWLNFHLGFDNFPITVFNPVPGGGESNMVTADFNPPP